MFKSAIAKKEDSSHGYQLVKQEELQSLATRLPGTPESDQVSPTETTMHGRIKFSGHSDKAAKYAIVRDDTDESSIRKLYDDTLIRKWKMKPPKIIISVTGGAQNFNMRPRLTKEFRKSLFKAAVSTRAWIVSGGTHVGVMKHVGDAMADNATSRSEEVVVLGIATFGIVEDREKLKDSAMNKEIQSPAPYFSGRPQSLDKNHSHFILVDDDSVGDFGREIKLRTALESYIACHSSQTNGQNTQTDRSNKLPIVCILLQGGPGSLQTVYSAITKETPVVVVGDSGGWANILATLYADGSNPITENRITELLSEQGTVVSDPKDLSNWTNMAKEIIKRKKLVTVFALDDFSSVSHLDNAILQAVLCSSYTSPDDSNTDDRINSHLQLALDWNRSDIAEASILTDGVKIDSKKLMKHFFEVLEEKNEEKSDFIRLFLDYGLELHKDPETKEKINKLYEVPKNTPLYDFSKRKNDDPKRILKSLMGSLFKPSDEQKFKDENDVLRELFQWAIESNKRKMANIFWHAMSKERFSAAVVANKLLTGMRKRCSHEEWKIEYEEHAQIYRKRSVGILNECYENNAEDASKLLTRKLKCWGNVTCLHLAASTNDYEFVSHKAVQHLLGKIWLGGIIKKEHKGFWYHIFFWSRIFLCAFFPFLLLCTPIVRFEKVQAKEKDDEEKESKILHHEMSFIKPTESSKQDRLAREKDNLIELDPFSKVMNFYKAPIVKFFLNVFCYLAYLSLFAYVLLSNSSPAAEQILLAWVIILALDEIRQILDFKIGNIFRKIWHWIDEFGNKLDLLSFVLFIIGFIVRQSAVHDDAAKVLLVLSFIFYCTRVLSLFNVHEELGPKLLMVGKMMKDIMFFIFIWAVFLVAYGVASQSLLYPNESRVGDVFAGILSKPYWQIYGELFLPEIDYNPTADEFSCTNNASLIDAGYRRCPEQNVIVPILSALYMLLANVLLLNLLIAMFSYTFEKLVNKTGKIWRFQRYALIKEYYYRPFLVVPFSIISYVYSLIIWLKGGFKSNPEEDDEFVKELSGKELQDLLRLEHFLIDSYLQEQKLKEGDEISSRIQAVSDRLETLGTALDKVSGTVENQRRLDRRVRAIEAKLHNSNESLQWIISAMRDNNTIPTHQPKPVHYKARSSKYPGSDKKRVTVDDHMVSWNIPMNDYNPPHYTAHEVLGEVHDETTNKWVKDKKPSWADDDLDSVPIAFRTILPYNQFDHRMKVDRTSYERRYDVLDGLPRNPKGRTGLAGRGLLGRYGPNHAADPIVTRWQKDKNGSDLRMPNGKRVLEFIAIKRQDTGEWAIPGGMVDPGENVTRTLKREFTEESLNGKIDENIEEFFRVAGVEVYRGYVDDHRNTDNAWIETFAANFHDEKGDILGSLVLQPGEEAQKAKWKEVNSSLQLFADHEKFLKMVADMHKAHY